MPETPLLTIREAAAKQGSGLTVYLMEELGDARLNCLKLKKLIADASKLVENSTHRDHFFEVAGHLIVGIPQTIFKLEKALEATALAASRLDYEEIKQALLPEKAEELEEALKDVRIRYVQRRAGESMTPRKASEQLKTIAATLRESKDERAALASLGALLGEVEEGLPKTASEDRFAVQLEGLAKELETVKSPSRTRLSFVLRRMLGERTSFEKQGNSRQDVMDGFMKANPSMTKEDAEKAADEWEKNKDVVKDKHAASEHMDYVFRAVLDADKKLSGVTNTLEYLARNTALVPDRTSAAQMGNAAKRALTLVHDIQTDLHSAWMVGRQVGKQASEPVADEKLSRFEEGKPADPTENMSPEDAKKWKEEHDKNKDNFKSAGKDYEGKLYVVVEKNGKRKKEGPMDQRAAKSRFSELIGDPDVTFVGFERVEQQSKEASWKVDAAVSQVAIEQIQGNSREEVMDGFKKQNPDLTEAQLKEFADQWEKNKDVVKDKHAAWKAAAQEQQDENEKADNDWKA